MLKYKNRIRVLLLFIAVLLSLSVAASAEKQVYLGGFPFGIKMHTDGVYVSGIGEVDSDVGRVSPARDAGLAEGDLILSLNGTKTESAQDVADIIEASQGKMLKAEIKRDGKKLNVNIVPVRTADTKEYKTGLFIKDFASGIGTVTFVEEDGRIFGGLGHGITDRSTGGLLPLGEGSVYSVKITDVVKGNGEAPGELKGQLDGFPIGVLLKNTNMGAFAKAHKAFKGLERIKVASPGEIKKGECIIHTCLNGNTPCQLKGEITEIVDKSSKTKNFVVSLTDKACLERTGGIVQGMSGSPIVQNGKLVGAVTHVLMRDQTSGYGIFIENMLSEAEKISD